ncbi:MAG: RdgB/HAM1 family non-canonical purine NTP pyrophosphatase [Candidatus Thorarchaeota archaeon]
MSKDSIVVLVTQNKHKLAELTPLFNEYEMPFETTSLEKFEIRSKDVEEIAGAAARHAFMTLNRPVVLDDTGFYVSALKEFPGAYAAFALKSIGYEGILKLLEGVEDRSARFVTAVGFCDGPNLETFVGEMRGTISEQPSGSEGFGYDPIFIPEGFTKTYAELTFDEKVSISHRTKAFRAFLEWGTSIPNNP